MSHKRFTRNRHHIKVSLGVVTVLLALSCSDYGTSSRPDVPLSPHPRTQPTVVELEPTFEPTPPALVSAPVSAPTVTQVDPLPTTDSAGRAVPILGGTLGLTRDGRAIVVDPDRDQLFIVDVDQGELLHSVAFEDGDEPGRFVEDDAGSLYVVLRRGAAVAEVELSTGELVQRISVCPEPRGIAWDGERDALVVTCLDGYLDRIEADGSLTHLSLGRDDLRDIVVEAPYYLVSRWKSADLLVVNPDTGVVHDRLGPPGYEDATSGKLVPGAAFKMSQLGDGRVVVQHQRANKGQLIPVYYGPVDCMPGIVHSMVTVLESPEYPEPYEPPARQEAADSGISYSAQKQLLAAADAGTADPADAGRAFTKDAASTSELDAGSEQPKSAAPSSSYAPSTRRVLRFASPAVERVTDYAVAMEQDRYIAITNAAATSEYVIGTFAEMGDESCYEAVLPTGNIEGQASAVAFAVDGTPLVQTRQPATLFIVRSSGAIAVSLSEDDRAHAGHYAFHARTESGLACTSCHLEGGDDGNIWNFAGLGFRRTQALWGGLSQTAPFHWAGEHATLDAVLADTLTSRMRGLANMTTSDDLGNRLEHWLDTLASPSPVAALDEALSRGRTAFEKAECNSCHSGGRYTDNASHDVGTGGSFQTPTLLGLRFRAPYMHNGCATTLEERFTACGGAAHGKPSALDEGEMRDLLGYLQSL